MNRYSSTRDMTMAHTAVAPGGGDMRLMWMCGHRSRAGQYRPVPGLRPIAWRCAECATRKGKE